VEIVVSKLWKTGGRGTNERAPVEIGENSVGSFTFLSTRITLESKAFFDVFHRFHTPTTTTTILFY